MATEAPAAPPAVPSQTAGPGTAHNDAYSAIDGLFGNEPAQPSEKPQEEPASEPKVEPKQGQEKPEQQPPGEKPKPSETPPPSQPPKPEKAATLREAKDRLEAENKRLSAQLAEIQKKQSDPHPEKKKWDEERETLSKSRQQLEDELKFANYERTTEYKEKYETPFLNAYGQGRQKASSLKVKVPEKTDANGNIVEAAGVRQATERDFDTLMGISDDLQAQEWAEQTFGNGANLMMRQRERVQELNSARFQAIEDYRKTGLERDKKRMEQDETDAKQYKDLFQQEVKSGVENPALKEWFNVEDGDEIGKQLLQKGIEMTDLAFGDTSGLTKQQRARLYAAVKNRAIAARVLDHKLRKLTAAHDELKKKLDDYENSEPNLDGKGGRKKGETTTTTGYGSADAAIDKMANIR